MGSGQAGKAGRWLYRFFAGARGGARGGAFGGALGSALGGALGGALGDDLGSAIASAALTVYRIFRGNAAAAALTAAAAGLTLNLNALDDQQLPRADKQKYYKSCYK